MQILGVVGGSKFLSMGAGWLAASPPAAAAWAAAAQCALAQNFSLWVRGIWLQAHQLQQLGQPQLNVRSRERSPLGLPTHVGCIGFPERVISLTLSGPHSHLTLSTSFKHDASLQSLRSPIGQRNGCMQADNRNSLTLRSLDCYLRFLTWATRHSCAVHECRD